MKKIFTLLLSLTGYTLFAAQIDLQLTSIDAKSTVLINQNILIGCQVTNTGEETVTSFTVEYSIDGESKSVSFSDISIAPFSTEYISLGSYIPTEAKKHIISADITSVNGLVADFSSLAHQQKDFHALLKTVTKRAVAEEATGTWCGFCPRGAVYMDQAKEDFGDEFIGIAVHNSDPMELAEYDNGIANYITGYPAVVLDRALTTDPSFLPTKIPTRLDNDATADIGVYGYYDDAEEVLHVTVTATFESADEDIDYRLNVVVTEDDVTGTTSGYNQVNYYSGGGYGPLEGWEYLPNPVPAADMVYNFVARVLAEDMEGAEESVPTTVTAGQYVSYDFEIDIDSDWDMDQLNVIGLLIDNDDDDLEILNANQVRMTELVTGLNDKQLNFDLDIFPNPATQSTNVRMNLPVATDLKMTVTDMNGNIMAEKNYGMQTGDIALPINTSTFANGVYIISIVAGDQIISEKLNVLH